MLLAPAQALEGRIELLLGGGDNALAIKGDQSLLALDSRVESRADTPNAGAVFRVRARGDEEAIHGPMMVGAKRQAVVWFVVAGHVERDEVRSVNEGKTII